VLILRLTLVLLLPVLNLQLMLAVLLQHCLLLLLLLLLQNCDADSAKRGNSARDENFALQLLLLLLQCCYLFVRQEGGVAPCFI